MKRFRYAFQAMGSPCEVQCWADDEPQAHVWFACVQDEVERIEAKYSRYRETSVLSHINQRAGQGAFMVDDETAHLLNYAQACYDASDGAFDITCGALRRVWDFKAQSPQLPHPEQLAQVLHTIGWSNITWRSPTLTLPAGMELDFGGVAKEYAADRAATLCGQIGASALLINLGGDIRALGAQPEHAPWRIGIVHPRAQPATTLATLELPEGAIATSGDYQRFFDIQGVRYCHLLDARTGWPAPECPQSVSVVAPACMVAGSVSTVAMLKGRGARAWLAASGLRYLLVTHNGEVYQE